MALCIHFKILTPLAVGYDAKNQDTVKSIFVSDLQDFREGKSVSFYHGGLKRNVIVYLDLLASLQDQPERCSANCIMLGTSKYTACWGLAMDIGAVASRVLSCASCLSLLTNGIINSNCSICVNWDLRRDSILLHFPSPMNYPPSMLSEHAMLKPLVITYDVLKHAVRAAHNGFVNNGWSSSNVKIYLHVHGINTEALQDILECAKNFKAMMDLPEGEPQRVALMIKQCSHPELFTMWKFPTLWCRNVHLSQHIDVIMHLLFLGVVKSSMQNFLDFFALRGKQAAFLKHSNTLLESVQKLHLGANL